MQSFAHCSTQHPCLYIGGMDLTDVSLGGYGLTGGLHLKSCSKQLNVQVETSDKCCSSGVGIGTFDIFVSDMDSGIQCTLSKFAIDTLEGRNDIQRGLETPQMDLCNPYEVQQCQVQGPVYGSMQPKHKWTKTEENGLRAALTRVTWEV